MTTKIQKWGNSLAIRLPKAFIEFTPFSLGAEVLIEKKGSELILKPVKRKYPPLKELLKGMTRANFEPMLDWGPDVGNEIID
jgi:antitoxin MazE